MRWVIRGSTSCTSVSVPCANCPVWTAGPAKSLRSSHQDGRFYLHDRHPMAWSLTDDRLCLEHTYFEEIESHVEDSEATYTDADRPLVNQRTYEWNHSIGETATAMIRPGLRLEWLQEHDWTVWPRFPWLIASSDGSGRRRPNCRGSPSPSAFSPAGPLPGDGRRGVLPGRPSWRRGTSPARQPGLDPRYPVAWTGRPARRAASSKNSRSRGSSLAGTSKLNAPFEMIPSL
jgi:hypothetical protein